MSSDDRSARTICVDARAAFAPTRRGIGKCLVELYRHLATIRTEWHFSMFHRNSGETDPFQGMPNIESRKIEMPGDRWGLWQRSRLPLAAKWVGADVLHCPANTGPRWPLVPMVLTIHDLIPLQPEFVTERSRVWGRDVAAAARRARRITTPSSYSKSQIVDAFAIPAEKIAVHHWGPNPMCRPIDNPAELASVTHAHGLEEGRPYVMAFGGADPRKNGRRILCAWERLPSTLRKQYSLVMIGVQEPLLAELQNWGRAAGMAGSCVINGYVSEGDVATLLGGASLLCYPSLSEGFGLPVLDAFACETAVLTSKVTSIPEVAGDAVHYVDPNSEQEIADGISFLLRDHGARAELVEKGRQRLALFSWQQCAETFCEAVESTV
jgi:glycosyltransferase involved in cell wall biosynthesis